MGVKDWIAKGEHAVGRAVDAGAHAVGDGLDTIGLHGAAKAVDHAGDTVADTLGVAVPEKQLGETDDPKELIHGDVGKINTSIGHLNTFATAFGETADGLAKIDTAHWTGKTADAFHAKYKKHPKQWSDAHTACADAASALQTYAQVVKWAQGQAQSAIELYNKGQQATAQAKNQYQQQVNAYNSDVRQYNDAVVNGQDPGSAPQQPGEFTDSGAAERQQAQQMLDDARKQRDSAAKTATSSIKTGTDLAPKEPSFGQQLKDFASDFVPYAAISAEHFLGGVLKGTGGILKFARSLNIADPYNITHPAEYVDGLSNTAAGLVHDVVHPNDLLSSLVGSGWSSDPAQAFGELVPNAALAVGTDGAGTAADAGIDVGERAAIGAGEDAGERGAVGAGEDASTSAERDGVGEPRDNAQEPGQRCDGGEPIDVASGEMFMTQRDVELAGVLPLAISRTHVSSYRVGRWFGPSWSSTLDQRLIVDRLGVLFFRDNGVVLCYPHPVKGPVLPVEGARWPLVRTTGGYRVDDPDSGRALHFSSRPGASLPISAITDRNGNAIVFEYDAAGTPIEVRGGGYRIRVEIAQARVTALYLHAGDEEVELIRYGYDMGNLNSVVNSSGLPMVFRYDAAGRITDWIDRSETRYHYDYDDAGRCVYQAGSDGVLEYTFEYDSENRITVVTDSLGGQRGCYFNDHKQLVREVDAIGNETRSEWDRYDRLLSKTDPLGRTTKYEYDQHGNLIAVIRPDLSQTLFEYNELRLPIMVINPDGTAWRQEYDVRGNRIVVIDPSGASTRYHYNERGHLVGVTDALGNRREIETNAAGLTVAVIDATGAVTRHVRDAFGRSVRVVDPLGGVTTLDWTVEGKLARQVTADGASETWRYDGEGNLVEHVDAAGNVATAEYTHFDMPSAVTTADGARLEYRYDTQLRLTTVVNPQGLTWGYEYDPAGRLVGETDFNGRALRYSYDAAGQLTERTNGMGQRVDYLRDVLGNVMEQRCGDIVTRFEYDLLGRLTHATNPDADLRYRRDPMGRVLAETVNGRTVASGYDPLGRRIQRHTPSGAWSAWEYDAVGNPVSLSTGGQLVRFEHDPAGREVHRFIGAAAVLSHSWDPAHRLTTQTLFSTGEAKSGWMSEPHPEPAPVARLMQRRDYRYRPDGCLAGVDDHLRGARQFELDTIGRVTSVRGEDWSERYAYDSAGNVTAAVWPIVSGGEDILGGRAYHGTLITRAGNVHYRHDKQGRVISRQRKRLSAKDDVWQYDWDAEDRLTGVRTPDGSRWRYSYDPLGRRIAKQRLGPDGVSVVERVDFSWDGTTLAEQTIMDPRHANVRTTTWDFDADGRRPIGQTERVEWRDAPQAWADERFYAIVTDLVGTPSELVDPDGSIAWHARTTLWGTTTWLASGAYTPLRFPGQYHDPETGLNYNYARYYDPASGRYVSTDPLGLKPAPNPNAYVPNPHTWADPLGLAPDDCGSGNTNANTGGANRFPATAEEMTKQLGVPPTKVAVTPDGTTRTVWHPSENIRIRGESHPEGLSPGDPGYNPRHHGYHYHVEVRDDPNYGWNNKNHVTKEHPPGYTPGSGTGFVPGEAFPGAS